MKGQKGITIKDGIGLPRTSKSDIAKFKANLARTRAAGSGPLHKGKRFSKAARAPFLRGSPVVPQREDVE